MKWFDDLLEGKTPTGVDLEQIEEGDIILADKDGVVRAPDASKLADLRADISPGALTVRYRLRVPHDRWDELEVVCTGNALDVSTEPMEDGRYKVNRRLRGYKPAVVDEETILELPSFESTKDFINWVETLDTDAVEALRQIYYDRWTFKTGEPKDRIYYELLEEEKKGRKQ